MISLTGYQICAQIHQSHNSLIYRGYRQEDNLPVIFKVLRQEYPTPTQLTHYRQEYQITHHLNLEGVVKSYSLENYQNTLIIILEDFGGESLKILTAQGSLTLKEFLQIAIAITEALGTIHAANIIHKDINPSNIVYNSQTQKLKIIDFGISTRLTQENPTLNPDTIEGTLAYISPEQTGRMNRALDYRSDFYSLGVTFYELLSGKLPFDTQDSLELIHCHLAKQPPSLINQDLPPVIADIVTKLMSKNAEQRYQSTSGIKTDLEQCLQQLTTSGTINIFPLATQDIASRLQIPQKLYGRETEIQQLLTACHRLLGEVEQSSRREIVLVAGYSGIGKSSLVKEIYPSLSQYRGYLITGKFDQYQRDIPYYAIIQALRQLIGQILTETTAQLKQWQAKLQAALGVNGRVIIEVIPEVELIIGTQPAIPDLGATEAQNRFNLVFQNFIQVFTQAEHPLVLFLDDLQWADLASLNLIKLLVNTPDLHSLLLIGAYRDREVSASHPLMLTIEEIKEQGVTINQINLAPLNLKDINHLVAETLNSRASLTEPLAKLLQVKTNGNPFFLKEFLKSLAAENLLKFNPHSLSWQWDIEEIQKQQITDNVVELMSNKIERLTFDTQQNLRLSSCIGNQFELKTLAIIAETSPQDVALSLQEAIAEGLILPLSGLDKSLATIKPIAYKFVHDKIQQAAYSLIDEQDRARLHLQIARLLLQNTDLQQQPEKIFDIVNQFNNAQELINDPGEKNNLVQLNYQAAKKAQVSGAYQSAFNYLQISQKLLSKDSWSIDYDLTLKIYQDLAQVAYLNRNYKQMQRAIATILQQAIAPLDKAIAYEINIKACFAQGQLTAGIKLSLEILQLLGIKFPDAPSKIEILIALWKTKLKLLGHSIADLANLPPMQDAKIQAVMRIIQGISFGAFMSQPSLYILLVLKRINLSLKYGNNFDAATAYATYGFIITTITKDILTGYQFGELAIKLMNQYEPKREKTPTIILVNNFIFPYKKPLRGIIDSYLIAHKNGLEMGDLVGASSAIVFYLLYSYYSGIQISKIDQQAALFKDTLQKIKQQNLIELITIYRQTFSYLMSKDFTSDTLIAEIYDELELLPLQQENNKYLLFHLYLQKSITYYIFQAYPQALSNIEQARQNFNDAMGQVFAAALNFYESLINLSVYNSVAKNKQRKINQKVKNNQKVLKIWANYAPMNYLHKYYLVEAEKQRILDNYDQAIDLYDSGINLAHKHQYLQEEALACELAAKFYFARGNNLVAATYMKQARFCYLNWGAKAKVKDLDDNYADLLVTTLQQSTEENLDLIVNSSATKQEKLDLNTLIKTSQALAQITDFSQLLQTLIKFVLENAGAEKGFLILIQRDNLIIQASGTTKEITTLQATPVASSHNLSATIINYVYRTQTNLVLNDASGDGLFINDEYIKSNQIKSVLCLPIINQGSIVAILYLENNFAANVFTAERLEILKLISSQAAISIKNALFAQQEQTFTYQVGGCLTLDAPSYAIRQADLELYQYLQQGHYCYILNSRHMGKSSLRVRIMERLQTEGTICLAIDLTSIGSKNITAEQWYAGVIYSLVNNLQLAPKFDFRHWWRSLEFLSPVQKFNEFIQQVLLPEVKGKIVIFIDEIDSTLGLNFNLDDFFALIRSCYNNRADRREYQRLSFVLLGVASPCSLVQDKNCTPFNIGKAIALAGFQLHEVKPLTQGLANKYHNPQVIMEEVLAWTSGQPFLTQKICNLLADTDKAIAEGKEAVGVENLVRSKIIDNWESQDDPQHLKTICDRLFYSKLDSRQLLQIYQQILHQGEIIADDSSQHKELLLSGLVKQVGGKLQVYNRIYKLVFDLNWCYQALAVNSR